MIKKNGLGLHIKILILIFMSLVFNFFNVTPAFAGTNNFRYIIFEIDGFQSSNGATINEVQLFDNNNNNIVADKIPFAAYDQVSNSVPAYWTSSIWGKNKLTDGLYAYSSNYEGSNTSAFFFYTATTNNNVKARFAFDLGQNYSIEKINMIIGGSDKRNPKQVLVYGTNNYSSSQVSSTFSNADLTLLDTVTPNNSSVPVTYSGDVILPPNMPSVSLSNITASSAQVNWTTDSTAFSYDILINGAFLANTTNSSYSLTNLLQNTNYTVSVIGKNSAGDSSPGIASFDSLQLPNPPTGLQATNITSSSMDLSWNSVAGSISYILDQSGNILASTNNSFYHVTGLSPETTYFYRVAVKTSAGESDFSDSISFTTLGVPPLIPTGLSFDNLSINGFTLYWLRQPDADSYNVYANGSLIANVPQTILFNPSYNFSNLTQNTNYNITVIAVNTWGQSSASQPLGVITLPEPPGNLQASNITPSSVTLTWSSVLGATNYILDQDDNIIATTTNTSYVVNGLNPNTNYLFKVAVITQGGQSDYSAPISIDTLGLPPSAPTGLSYNNLTDGSFDAYWLKQADAISYDVYLNGILVGNVSQPLIYNPAFSFENLAPNTAYTLTVIARNSWGESSSSQTLTVTTLITPPNGLLRVKNITSSSVDLSWSAIDGASSYAIAENDNLIAVVSNTSYTVTGLTPQTNYEFKMAAINDSGQGDYSTPTNITTLGVPPSAPTGINYNSLSSDSLSVQWPKLTDATSYNVYLNGALISNITASDNPSFTFNNLTSNTSYFITVNAQNTWGLGQDSSPLSVTTLPNPPQGLKATNVTLNSIALSWSAVPGATNYILKQDGNVVSTLSNNYYIVTDLNAFTTYDFQVSVITAAGQSIDSDPLSISTLGFPPVQPTMLSYSDLTQSSFNVFWNKQPDAKNYNIYLNGNFIKTIAQPLFYNPSYSFTGLDKNKTYKVTVVAANPWGQSPVSDPLVVMTTLNPVLSASVDGKNLILTWQGSADAFLVYINDQQVTATNINQYTFEGDQGKSYALKVIGVVQGKQFTSNIITRSISAIPTVGLSQVTNDLTDNVGKVAGPIGGIVVIGLGLKASPFLISLLKSLVRWF